MLTRYSLLLNFLNTPRISERSLLDSSVNLFATYADCCKNCEVHLSSEQRKLQLLSYNSNLIICLSLYRLFLSLFSISLITTYLCEFAHFLLIFSWFDERCIKSIDERFSNVFWKCFIIFFVDPSFPGVLPLLMFLKDLLTLTSNFVITFSCLITAYLGNRYIIKKCINF